MEEKQSNVTFRRENTSYAVLLFAGWGMMMLLVVLWGMTEGFTTWIFPVWKMQLRAAVFITLFLCAWFGMVLGCIWMALRCLHRVHISPEEVKICLGPLVLHRLELSQIKTVIRTGDSLPQYGVPSLLRLPRDKHGNERRQKPRLVLCNVGAEELLEKSRSFKQKHRHREARMADRNPTSAFVIKRYISKHPCRKRFWMEYSPEAEAALRQYLSTSVFVV